MIRTLYSMDLCAHYFYMASPNDQISIDSLPNLKFYNLEMRKKVIG